MKKNILFLIVLTLLFSICGASSAVTEDEFLWSNMNTDPVKNGTPYYLDLVMEEEEPIQLERITTYHWNNGEGAEPGTVSIYLGDALLSSWPAVGRSAYGTENVYWDAAVNIILMPGYTYSFRLSDEDSWSFNAASDNCGMIELYGHRLFDFNTNKGQTDGSQDQCAVPDPGIEVILNNKSLVMLDEKGMPTGPIVLNETVYIPAPTVTQITGMDISFDSTTNQVIIMPAEEIKIVVNNETYSSTVINNNSFGPVIINDHVLLPIETVAEITGHKVDWDQNNHVLNITDPTETPAHGKESISGTDTVPAETSARGYWKLTETTPYKMEDEYITANTKNHYGYDVINGGVRYTYDVTSGGTSDKDYYHFTAYGEVSDPPETGYPGEKLTMDLHCWVDPGSLEGNGNFSTYSSLYMGYCHNYLANWDYAEYACGNPWTNVNYDGTNENKTSFSSGDGYPAYTRMNESGQVCMIFPEGESGDILEIESLLHIGDRHPLTTTWKYVFVEENQMTAG